jgi:hypothetical protein
MALAGATSTTAMLHFIAAFAQRLRGVSRCYVADPRPVGGSMFRIPGCRGAASQPVVVVRSRRRVETRLLQPPVGDPIREPLEIEHRDMHRVTFARAAYLDEIPSAVPAFEVPQRFSRDSEAPSPGRSPLVRQPEVHCQAPLLQRRRLSRPRLLAESVT